MKNNQERINKAVLTAMEDARREYLDTEITGLDDSWERLHSCQAWVLVGIGNWVFLKSYKTIVAAIDTHNWMCYDFSRYVYGYTATTCQHIRKFAQQYNADVLTYRE